MKIGDVTPFPADANMKLALYRQRGRGRLAKIAGGKGNNQVSNGARKIIAELHDNAKRDRDPFHQAVTFLGRQGFCVFFAGVQTKGAKGYVVGRLRLPDQKAVMELARKKGWAG